MRDTWLKLCDSLLHPARPHRERCLRERESHSEARRALDQERTRARARCEARIESARAAVFAADDGVVPLRMRDLEREWRRLARPDFDGGLMDLWARVAPPSWIDRKRWRDAVPAAQIDAAIALAADVEGIEAVESAVESLGRALAPWGSPIGSRIRWCASEHDFEHTAELLAEPLRAARHALSMSEIEPVALERAHELERDVHEAASVRFPERPLLASAVAHVAFFDFVWRAAALAGRPNPVTSLCAIWAAGYSLTAIDISGVTVAIPPL